MKISDNGGLLQVHSCKGSLERKIFIRWMMEDDFDPETAGWWICIVDYDDDYYSEFTRPVAMIKYCPFCGEELHEELEWHETVRKKVAVHERFAREFEPDVVITGNFPLSDIHDIKKVIQEETDVSLNTPYNKTKIIDITKEVIK